MTETCSRCRSKPAIKDRKLCESCLDYGRRYGKEHPKKYDPVKHKIWRDNNPEKIEEYHRRYTEVHREQESSHRKKYYQANKEKENAYAREWAKANPEKVREAGRRYYKTHLEKMKEKRRKYYQEHRDAILETWKGWAKENAESRKEYTNNWKKEHPDRIRARNRKQKAKRRGAPGSFSYAELQELFDEQNGCCFYCGELLYGRFDRAVHIDHKVPVARGGTNYISNIALACAPCNLTKQAKTAEEFMLLKK